MLGLRFNDHSFSATSTDAGVLTLAFVLAVCFFPVNALADSIWKGGVGNWNDDSEWDGGEPGSGDYAFIRGEAAFWGEVHVDRTGEVADYLAVGHWNLGRLIVESGGELRADESRIGNLRLGGFNGSGEVIVTGADAIWRINNDLSVGYGDDLEAFGTSGTMIVENGGQVANATSYIGYHDNATGIAKVIGAGSMWTSSGDMTIGLEGSGTLVVESGGQVSTTRTILGGGPDVTGKATVTGSGSRWQNSGELWVGSFGTGEVTVSGGGRLTNSSGIVGQSAGSDGMVTVTGSGSRWQNNGQLWVGSFGRGEVVVSAGGAVLNATGIVGHSYSGTVRVTGSDSYWTNGGNTIIGSQGSGTLQVAAGGTVLSQNNSYVGMESTGTVTVSGAQTTWTTYNDLYLNLGSLSIRSGGTVWNRVGFLGSDELRSASVSVSGAGSKWTNGGELHVGDAGEGILHVEDGGNVSGTNSYVGFSAGSTGRVTVTGADSSWTNSGLLEVGYQGSGSLTISDNAVVTNANGTLAYAGSSTGEATVTGEGSMWTTNGTLRVGRSGTGTLAVEDGGRVSSTIGLIGDNGGSVGIATVSGPGSTWTNSSSLIVGQEGDGTLTIANGGTISSSSGYLGQFAGGSGEVTVTGTGSSWTSFGMYVGGNSEQSAGTGTLTVTDSGQLVVTGAPLAIWNSGTVTLDGGGINTASIDHTNGGAFEFLHGTLQVDNFLGTLDQYGGTLAPGNSPGTTNITGNYHMNAGSLEIVIFGGGGVAGTDFDVVDVTGTAMLSGELSVNLQAGFVPDPLDSFRVLTAGSLSGTFANVANGARLNVSGGGSFLVSYDGVSSNVVLSDFLAGVPGDFNGDGDVDGRDFLHWQRNPSVGNLADWQNNYGYAPTEASFNAVPEPNTALLLLVVGVALLAAGRAEYLTLGSFFLTSSCSACEYSTPRDECGGRDRWWRRDECDVELFPGPISFDGTRGLL